MVKESRPWVIAVKVGVAIALFAFGGDLIMLALIKWHNFLIKWLGV